MSEQRQRSGNVRIRLTGDEEQAIRAKASAAGLSVSAFVRAAALGRKVPPAALVAGVANLGRLGGLLKLALAQVESGGGSAEARAQLAATLAAIRRAADALREAVS